MRAIAWLGAAAVLGLGQLAESQTPLVPRQPPQRTLGAQLHRPAPAPPRIAPLITPGANPIVAGRQPMTCLGAVVVLGNANLELPNGDTVANAARAGIVGVNLPPAIGLLQGTRVILVDSKYGSPQQVTDFSFASTLFLYSHECSHLIYNHITQPVPTEETDADCKAASIISSQHLLTRPLMDLAAGMFDQNPPIPPFYPAGVLRHQHIMQCYDNPALAP